LQFCNINGLSLFAIACVNGNLDIVKYIYNTISVNLDNLDNLYTNSSSNKEPTIDLICESGRYNVACWLAELDENQVNISECQSDCSNTFGQYQKKTK